MTTITKGNFYRVKAAMHDLIDRAGGIERAAGLCGYSKSAVGRWNCRDADDMMPLAVVIALETETGSHFVTQAMCALHGIETVPGAGAATQFLGAYVAVSQNHSNLQAVVAESLADGVVTGAEQQRIEAAAAGVDRSNEALRGTIAAAAGAPLKVVG